MTSMKNQTIGNKSYCLYEEINVWHLCPDPSAKPPDHMGEATFCTPCVHFLSHLGSISFQLLCLGCLISVLANNFQLVSNLFVTTGSPRLSETM